jgi:hypothetical protein
MGFNFRCLRKSCLFDKTVLEKLASNWSCPHSNIHFWIPILVSKLMVIHSLFKTNTVFLVVVENLNYYYYYLQLILTP